MGPQTTGAESQSLLGGIKEAAQGLPAAAGTSWLDYGPGHSDPCGPRAAHPCGVCAGHRDSAGCLRVSGDTLGAGGRSGEAG